MSGQSATAADEQRDQLFDALARRLAQSDASTAWDSLVAGGVAGFRIDEEFGGLGLPASDAEPVMAALGEACWPTPFIESSVVAAGLLGKFQSERGDNLLRVLAEGKGVCTVAGLEPALREGLSASRSGESWVLDGTARLVLDGEHAAGLIAIVPVDGGIALFLLDPDSATKTHPYPTIDGRHAADLRFDRAPAHLLSADANEAVAIAFDEALACIAIEAAAIMRRVVRDTVAYVRQRRQFGQALSEFQVVQHRLVDMHIHARRAGAIARKAMAALNEAPVDRSRIISAAKATVAAAGRYVGQQAVQLHGAMGMTGELALGRCFRRLTVIERELGSAEDHAARHARLRDAS